jgi:hypothetical protein
MSERRYPTHDEVRELLARFDEICREAEQVCREAERGLTQRHEVPMIAGRTPGRRDRDPSR